MTASSSHNSSSSITSKKVWQPLAFVQMGGVGGLLLRHVALICAPAAKENDYTAEGVLPLAY